VNDKAEKKKGSEPNKRKTANRSVSPAKKPTAAAAQNKSHNNESPTRNSSSENEAMKSPDDDDDEREAREDGMMNDGEGRAFENEENKDEDDIFRAEEEEEEEEKAEDGDRNNNNNRSKPTPRGKPVATRNKKPAVTAQKTTNAKKDKETQKAQRERMETSPNESETSEQGAKGVPEVNMEDQESSGDKEKPNGNANSKRDKAKAPPNRQVSQRTIGRKSSKLGVPAQEQKSEAAMPPKGAARKVASSKMAAPEDARSTKTYTMDDSDAMTPSVRRRFIITFFLLQF
jgi:hypothetical protein